MRAWILTFALASVTLIQAGCAAGIRAGGEHRGVGAGAAIGPATPLAPPPPPPPHGAYIPP